MSNRLAAAYADAWITADYASSSRALKEDVWKFEDEYKIAHANLSAQQTKESNSRGFFSTIAGGVGAAIGCAVGAAGGGPLGCVKGGALGFQIGSETGEMAFDTGYFRTGDETLDRMLDDLEGKKLELSDKAKRYGALKGEEKVRHYEAQKERDIAAYYTWEDQFYQDSWGHMADFAVIALSDVVADLVPTEWDSYTEGDFIDKE